MRFPVSWAAADFATGLRRFSADERGATAIEYALIAAGISVAIASVVVSAGDNLKSYYQKIETALPG